MARFRYARQLSAAGLVVLALLAVILSAAALMQYRPSGEQAAPATAVPTATDSPGTPQETAEPAGSPSPDTSPTAPDGEAPEDPTAAPTTPSPLTVVVIGDSFSVVDAGEVWLGDVSEAMGWDDVVNLSSPGRGFIAQPRSCDFQPCGPFGASVPAIADAEPDLVITFGGTADGDYGIGDLTASYFERLREALPDAELVAISPVTAEDSVPYWLTMHYGSISTAVASVDGTYIDVGQPGLGDGESLSAQAHAEIAEIVTQELSTLLG